MPLNICSATELSYSSVSDVLYACVLSNLAIASVDERVEFLRVQIVRFWRRPFRRGGPAAIPIGDIPPPVTVPIEISLQKRPSPLHARTASSGKAIDRFHDVLGGHRRGTAVLHVPKIDCKAAVAAS